MQTGWNSNPPHNITFVQKYQPCHKENLHVNVFKLKINKTNV